MAFDINKIISGLQAISENADKFMPVVSKGFEVYSSFQQNSPQYKMQQQMIDQNRIVEKNDQDGVSYFLKNNIEVGISVNEYKKLANHYNQLNEILKEKQKEIQLLQDVGNQAIEMKKQLVAFNDLQEKNINEINILKNEILRLSHILDQNNIPYKEEDLKLQNEMLIKKMIEISNYSKKQEEINNALLEEIKKIKSKEEIKKENEVKELKKRGRNKKNVI